MAKNTVNYSDFARLSFAIMVTCAMIFREMSWTKPLGLYRTRRSAWEVLLRSKMGVHFAYFEDAKPAWI